MAGYRQIHSRMWSSDQWFADLEPNFKLLFIYLFSNERASVSGLYELPIRVMAFETGLDVSVIRSGLEAFGSIGKVKYEFESGVVWVCNMFKYQGSTSPKLKDRMIADVKSVPECSLKDLWLSENRVLIGYGYGKEEEGQGIDTSSSFSFSSSSSRSGSGEGGGTGEGTETGSIPKTVKQAAEHPDIQVYKRVSGRMPGSGDYQNVIETIQLLRGIHGDGLEKYLSQYWTEWDNRKTKEGVAYAKTSLVWLCEWAVSGDVPRVNGHEPQRSKKSEAAARQKYVTGKYSDFVQH